MSLSVHPPDSDVMKCKINDELLFLKESRMELKVICLSVSILMRMYANNLFLCSNNQADLCIFNL